MANVINTVFSSTLVPDTTVGRSEVNLLAVLNRLFSSNSWVKNNAGGINTSTGVFTTSVGNPKPYVTLTFATEVGKTYAFGCTIATGAGTVSTPQIGVYNAVPSLIAHGKITGAGKVACYFAGTGANVTLRIGLGIDTGTEAAGVVRTYTDIFIYEVSSVGAPIPSYVYAGQRAYYDTTLANTMSSIGGSVNAYTLNEIAGSPSALSAKMPFLLVGMGDSYSSSISYVGFGETAYTESIPNSLIGCSVLFNGTPGANLASYLTRYQDAVNLAGLPTDFSKLNKVFVLQLTVNGWMDGFVDQAEADAYLVTCITARNTIASYAAAAGYKVIITGISPASLLDPYAVVACLNFNEDTLDFCKSNRFAYVDMWSLLKDKTSAYSSAGIDPAYDIDGTHPNTEGGRVIAAAISSAAIGLVNASTSSGSSSGGTLLSQGILA